MNVHEVTEHVLQLARRGRERGCSLRDYDPSLPNLSGDRQQLIQALLNILRNALEATAEQPRCEITLRTRSQRQFTIGEQRHRLVCRIDAVDNGPGIPPALRQTLFVPMVSGRRTEPGWGCPSPSPSCIATAAC
jgi:two-component system nitrogen regulation sensor histidine kinase GlnL